MCDKGYNQEIGSFTQYYDCDQLDASVLMIPLVGFLPPKDPRVISTVEAVEKRLLDNGFVLRYRTADDGAIDGLTGREGAFLACSFWLVDCLHMIGRTRRPRSSSGGCWRCATISACSPRSTTRWTAAGRQFPPGLLPCVTGQLGLPTDREDPLATAASSQIMIDAVNPSSPVFQRMKRLGQRKDGCEAARGFTSLTIGRKRA